VVCVYYSVWSGAISMNALIRAHGLITKGASPSRLAHTLQFKKNEMT
jgi:hypothetical protein